MKVLKKIFIIILGIIFFLFATSLIFLLFTQENYKYPSTWTTYKNNEYYFSFKHPFFLGSYITPARFTNDSGCNNSNPPPKPYFNINNDSEDFPESNPEGEYLYEKEYSYLIGSGECLFLVNDQGPRLISVYVFENEFSNVSFYEYISQAYKIYEENFHKRRYSDLNWKVEKKVFGNGILFSIILNNPKRRDLIYYQKLPNNKFIIMISPGYDNSEEVFMKMISSIKID